MNYEIPDDRDLPPWVKGQLPTQAMADLLRRHRSELHAANQRTTEARTQTNALGVGVALALWKKRGVDNEADYRTVWDALDIAGVQRIDHVGEIIAGELEEMADIVDWVDACDGIEPGCVAQAFEPEIRVHGVFAHRAKLIGVLEAQPEEPRVFTPKETTHENQ